MPFQIFTNVYGKPPLGHCEHLAGYAGDFQKKRGWHGLVLTWPCLNDAQYDTVNLTAMYIKKSLCAAYLLQEPTSRRVCLNLRLRKST